MSEKSIIIGAASEPERLTSFNIGGRNVELGPFFKAIDLLTEAEKIALQNPYSMRPMGMVGQASRILVGVARDAEKLPPDIGAVMHPLMRHVVGPMQAAAKQALKLRMHSAQKLLSHPTQTIPLTLALAASGTATATIVNPYLGSGGGVYNTQALWAITALESGPMVPTQGMLITRAIFAGHDYVAASLAGISASSSLAATQGWGWYIFGSDKRDRPHTTFSPWNLQGAQGIVGSIMRETGNVQLSLYNASGSTFNGVFHVHVKASLCGSPFKSDTLGDMFVPFHHQMSSAHKLAMAWPSSMASAFKAMQHRAGRIAGMDDELDSVLGADLYDPED